MTLGRRRVVRVPASSANLGPGFDVLAAALALHVEVEVLESGEFAIETELDIPRDRSNLVVKAFERLHPADGLTFRIGSQIPLSGGLGSSAAAIVAGLMAADHMYELDADVRGHAIEMDGHPDNVGAALEGGFVICDGRLVRRFEPPMGLEAVLVVPNEGVRTAEARRALPRTVPMADAVFNVAHASMLILGLASGDFELIGRALRDRLHQPYRAPLYPRSSELVEDAESLGALGATISGAGPAVLLWCMYEQTGLIVDAVKRRAAGWARVLRVSFETRGAYVTAL
jgi:homoserine kinase